MRSAASIHGWKFDAAGQCVEQPAEVASAPKCNPQLSGAQEYLGLVFAWLGEGAPSAFPLSTEFESFEDLPEIDSDQRACNYFQNLENALEQSRVGFVHADNVASFSGIGWGAC